MTTETINLNKISLTKDQPSISLTKKGDIGTIRVNLNWDEGEKSGFFGKLFGSQSAIDLDLAAFVRLKNGDQRVIQALGDSFGSFNRKPFVHLLDDDRSGAATDGEWIHINGNKWDDIDEVLIYTFIYEGAPNWNSTNAVVTLHVPDQAPVETRLTDGNDSKRLCAIARIINDNGHIKVERINEFFGDQKAMDRAMDWGFNWSPGRK